MLQALTLSTTCLFQLKDWNYKTDPCYCQTVYSRTKCVLVGIAFVHLALGVAVGLLTKGESGLLESALLHVVCEKINK